MQDGDKQNTERPEPLTEAKSDDSQSPSTPWQFNSEADHATPVQPHHDTITWTASEFIAHEKTSSWYVLLGLGAIIFAAVVYLFTKDILSIIVIFIFAAVFGYFAARKPRVLTYSLDGGGLHIGDKFYPYADFRSFAVMDEGGINAIWLMPLKRFMPSLTIYYAPNDEDKIMDTLASYLPFEERDHDMVERLMRRVRF